MGETECVNKRDRGYIERDRDRQREQKRDRASEIE